MSEFFIDLDHIEDGVRNWERFVNSIDDAIDDGLEELYDKTDLHIDKEASKYGLDKSELHKTKDINLIDDTFDISYNSDYAQYVEYGTGIRGEESPHPNPEEWDEFMGYDVNGHGEDGWVYFDEKQQRLRWTAGMPARPVMYNTKVWLNTQATRIIRKHIRKKIERAKKR